MGWSLPYTLGVLGGWKMAPLYCQAVLCHDQRIALDGSPAETVEAEAKDLAAKQLAKLAARKAAKKAAESASLSLPPPEILERGLVCLSCLASPHAEAHSHERNPAPARTVQSIPRATVTVTFTGATTSSVTWRIPPS
jgi:sRNA-binding protein